MPPVVTPTHRLGMVMSAVIAGNATPATMQTAIELANTFPEVELLKLVGDAPNLAAVNQLSLTKKGRAALQAAIDAGAGRG